MNDKKTQEALDSAFEKQKPKLVFPIFNTVFAIAFMALLIYWSTVKDLNPYILIGCIFLLTLFIAASWYNSYFSKKRARKEIYNFQEETELLLKHLQTLKNKTIHEVVIPASIVCTYKEGEYIAPTTSFNIESKTFEPTILEGIQLHLGVTCAGLMVDANSKKVLGVSGMAPCSVWLYRKLTPPTGKPAQAFIDFNGYTANKNSVFKYMKHQDVYYDQKTGWLCFGERRSTKIDDSIAIAENVIMVLREQELVSLWIKIEPNLKIS